MAHPVSLTSTWFIRAGSEAAALPALERLAAEVRTREPDTLVYRIHTPYAGVPALRSLPPAAGGTVLFFEEYRDAAAFTAHLTGPVFTGFVAEHGKLFVGAHGAPFTHVTFLTRLAGFVRGLDDGDGGAAPAGAANAHPCGMFEIIARDQGTLARFYTQVFGWRYERGAAGFAYVHFATPGGAALGGIGQADPSIPGYAAGHSFYLLADDLDATLAAIAAAGGTCTLPPTDADGYRFAMFADPEANVIGLLQATSPGRSE